MDFFNSLAQVAKNKDNFKKWEANQKDEQAKREELYSRRQYSDEEIARAKALGENIIDVIDIMDNHSESVAENVETATQPLIAFAPFAGLGLSGLAAYKAIFKPNIKKADKLYKELIRSDEAKELCDKIYQSNFAKGNNFYFSTWQLTDKKSIDKIQDLQLRDQALKIYKKYTKEMKPINRGNKLGFIGMAAAALASFVGINIYAAKLQVDSSKIARYQARESLKDPKAFVTYTPEQIEKAKEEIKNNPKLRKQKKKEKLNTGIIKSIVNLFKDRKAYLNSVKNDTDESKLVTRELTPDEIKLAKQDQEVIQRTVRIINNEAEKYSQNMEVASEVLINGTPFLGAAIGGAMGWILNKTGLIDKIIEHSVKKNGSQKTKDLYADLRRGKESGKSVHVKWGKFMKSFMDDLTDAENNINSSNMTKEELKKARNASKGKMKDFGKYAKRFTTTAFAHPWGRNWIMSFIGGSVTGIAGALIGLKLQKSASRAGRYAAKRELEKDPRNFIGYTQDDYNEVNDVKSEKKKGSKVKEIIMFIPTCVKQYYEYEKFKKNEYKEKQLLQEQLMKQEVTDAQMRDAKNLQRKLFNTFEKVDDNSQTYSESMEAAIDIAQPFVMYGAIMTALSPIFVGAYLMYKGKLSPAKVLNKFLGFMSKSTDRMQSNWFKNYLKNVAKNVSTKVQDTQVSSKPLAPITAGINLKTDSVTQIISKTWTNLKTSVKDLGKMDPEKQRMEIYHLKQKICKVIAAKDEKAAGKVGRIFDSIMYNTQESQVRADALTMLMEPSAIKTMSKERYDKAYQLLSSITEEAVSDTSMIKEWDKIVKARQEFYRTVRSYLDVIDTNQLREIFGKLDEIPELKGHIKEEDFEKLIGIIEKHKPEHVDLESLESIVGQLEANPSWRAGGYSVPVNIGDMKKLVKAIADYDIDSLNKYIYELRHLKYNPNLELMIDRAKYDALLQSVERFRKQNTTRALTEDLKDILSHENVSNVITQIEKAKEQINKMPALLEKPEIKQLLSQLSETEQIPLNPKLKEMLLKEGLIKPEQETVSIMDIPKFWKYGKTKATSATIQDIWTHTMPKPKDLLGKMKDIVENMSEDDFLNKMEALNLSRLGMDKKTMLEIIPKIEKMMDNVPKEEMQQIMDTILKEMTEHPDEFLKFVTEGNPGSIVMTPGLKKALSIAGISWATFMVVVTYAIESWLADIKLKAGRLGVMKAMEGLDDYRYYANIETTEPVIKPSDNSSNLLDKYKAA